MTALGDLIEIDDRTVLVLGQELDLAHDQPDVANALVHRAGDTLVLVDTGVTPAFRAALRAAADRVGPWSRALLLTTHGHPDHVGNNDLADELGVPVEHYVPAPDLDQMQDPQSYWVRSFERIAWAAPLPAPELADKVMSLFAPMRPFAATTRTYEERPPERIRIGSQRFTGWTFADGAVRVLRSQGHCAGHVIVHLRDCGVLHLSDGATAPAVRWSTPTSSRSRPCSAPSPASSSRRQPQSSPTGTPSPCAVAPRRCSVWTGCWRRPPLCKRRHSG